MKAKPHSPTFTFITGTEEDDLSRLVSVMDLEKVKPWNTPEEDIIDKKESCNLIT
ncbi:MAG: hypothetical protein R2879_00150 [Saprospiraceae bacterium]